MGLMSLLGLGMYFKVHSDMIRCKKCGCENQLGSEFCSNCSSQLVTDVFISYSRKDYVGKDGIPLKNSVISEIKTALTAAGISYWFDEDGIYSGDEFSSVLARAIRNSTVFVFVSSANSNASRWTSNEISAAMQFEKPVIPFRIDDSPYNDSVLMKIISLDYIEYKYKGGARAMQRLIQGIQHWVSVHDERFPKQEELNTAFNPNNVLEAHSPSRDSGIKGTFKVLAWVVICLSVAYHLIAVYHLNNGDFCSPFFPHVLQTVILVISMVLSVGAIYLFAWRRKWLRNVVAFCLLAAGSCAPIMSFGAVYLKYEGGELWEAKTFCLHDAYPTRYPENIIPVSKWGKWGLVNGVTGEVIAPYTYDTLDRWAVEKGELISVELNGKWGFIDRYNNIVIPIQYRNVMSFKDGKAYVQTFALEWYYIDSTGKRVD